MLNVWSMTKKSFCFKNPFFAKNAIFSKIMSQSKDFWGLIQTPYISKHISRNGRATIKTSRKTLHDKVFFILGQKGQFLLKKWRHHKKKLVGAKISVHSWPAQSFRHSIDSHCLCMWVKNKVRDFPFYRWMDILINIIYHCRSAVYSRGRYEDLSFHGLCTEPRFCKQ